MPSEENAKIPKYTTEQVVDFYLERGGEIFDIPFFHKLRTIGGLVDEKYPAKGIEAAIEDYFGDTWLKDLIKPCLITSYDITRRKGHFFGQHKANSNQEYNFKVKDATRSTSAAPTYFSAAQVFSEASKDEAYNLIDGGVFVNNPALVAYSEGRNIFDNEEGSKARAKDMKILSIGTGFTRKAYQHDKATDWGMAEWVKPIIDIMMSGASDVTHYQLDKIYDTIDNPNQYLRINGDLVDTNVDPEMDCATKENMDNLKAFGTQLFEEHKEQIKAWLEL